MLQIDLELNQCCRICGTVDINFQKHTYFILFQCFNKISAAGQSLASYQSVPRLTVNCFLFQNRYGSWFSDSRHPVHRSSLLAVQVKFLPYWTASVAKSYASQWRTPKAWQHSVFCDRCCFVLSEKPPIISGLMNFFNQYPVYFCCRFLIHSLVLIYVCCSVMEAYECGNEHLSSIKCGEFLD